MNVNSDRRVPADGIDGRIGWLGSAIPRSFETEGLDARSSSQEFN
jgi:hypothetical protein